MPHLFVRQIKMEISDKSSQYKEEPFDKTFSWFISPIRDLKNNRSESSDGAFLAMSASVAMYERFLIKKAQAEGKGENTWDKRRKIAESQLNLKDGDFKIFWDCFRDGLQHQFQPTKIDGGKRYFWSLSDKYTRFPEIEEIDSKNYSLKVNPWDFAEMVYESFVENPSYFEKGKTYQAGDTSPLKQFEENFQKPNSYPSCSRHTIDQSHTLEETDHQTGILPPPKSKPCEKQDRTRR